MIEVIQNISKYEFNKLRLNYRIWSTEKFKSNNKTTPHMQCDYYHKKIIYKPCN